MALIILLWSKTKVQIKFNDIDDNVHVYIINVKIENSARDRGLSAGCRQETTGHLTNQRGFPIFYRACHVIEHFAT